jgi:hypothetical protein
MVRTFLKVYMELGSYFVSARTIKDIIQSSWNSSCFKSSSIKPSAGQKAIAWVGKREEQEREREREREREIDRERER